MRSSRSIRSIYCQALLTSCRRTMSSRNIRNSRSSRSVHCQTLLTSCRSTMICRSRRNSRISRSSRSSRSSRISRSSRSSRSTRSRRSRRSRMSKRQTYKSTKPKICIAGRYLPVTLLQLCECCLLIWMQSYNDTYRIPVVDCCVVLV